MIASAGGYLRSLTRSSGGGRLSASARWALIGSRKREEGESVSAARKSRFTRSGNSWCGFFVAALRVGCLADLAASDEFGQANGYLRVVDFVA